MSKLKNNRHKKRGISLNKLKKIKTYIDEHIDEVKGYEWIIKKFRIKDTKDFSKKFKHHFILPPRAYIKGARVKIFLKIYKEIEENNAQIPCGYYCAKEMGLKDEKTFYVFIKRFFFKKYGDIVSKLEEKSKNNNKPCK